MMARWDRSEVLLLIQLYKHHIALYDPKHKLYHNRVRRDEAVEAICTELRKYTTGSRTTFEVKSKIKTLRSQYANEKALIEKSIRSRRSVIYEPKLWCFKRLNFLDNYLKDRQGTSDSEGNVGSLSDDPPFHLEGNVTENVTSNSEDMLPTEALEITPEIEWPTTTTPSEQNNRKITYSHRSPIEQTIKKSQKISDENNGKETEFDLFCRSLAIQLNCMPVDRALICQKKLLQVMITERLYQMQCNSGSPTSLSDQEDVS